jgi:hypothetical protein
MKKYVFATLFLSAVLAGCHTSASFILPPNTDLMINGERIPFNAQDKAGRPMLERRPFFWSSIAGIEYRLVQGNKTVKKDRLPSSFRIVSIFWPPFAYIYWPVGFSFPCYDLSDVNKEFVEKCRPGTGPAGTTASSPTGTRQ